MEYEHDRSAHSPGNVSEYGNMFVYELLFQ
jgi:hypothetical protein